MTITDRIQNFSALGTFLGQILEAKSTENEILQNLQSKWIHTIETYHTKNAWFTPENIRLALREWAGLLNEENLTRWLSSYRFESSAKPKTIAVIAAGNIPMVGFHDVLSVGLSGHKLLLKLSSQDDALLPLVKEFLVIKNKDWENYFEYTQNKISGFDAVIATGSTNTSRYFEHYFGHVPHIIRKSRHSFAILNGEESNEELSDLAQDVFQYFGLGCRNVSKIWVPENFDFDRLFNAFYSHQDVMHHNKYMNNYDYHKAIYLMGQHPLLDNGFILLKEDKAWASPIGVLFYEKYNALEEVKNTLKTLEPFTQCVVSKCLSDSQSFGQAQKPKLTDYADGVDTLKFLEQLR